MILCAGLLAAWRPVETHALTAVVLAVGLLMLIPWAWERTSRTGAKSLARWAIPGFAFLVAGQAGGWDRSEAFGQAFLAAALMAAIWTASRERPGNGTMELFAIGLLGLAIWGLWQSFVGLDQLRVLTDGLPEHLHAGTVARIDRGRAFASMLLPSHLAVVLATALPIVMVRIGRGVRGFGFGIAFVLGFAGLVATRSPAGMVLAVGACALVLMSGKKRILFGGLGFGAAAMAVVLSFRPDVLRLEPLVLRFDNWGSALWVWSKSPIAGVGLGGFGPAAQAVPWEVGNHPVHAHCLPLELLADLGVFGLAAWGLAVVWLLGVVRRLWPTRPEIAVALMVIPMHNLVDFSLYVSSVALPWAVLVGWSFAMTRCSETNEDPVLPALRWVPTVAAASAVAVTLLALTGFTLKEAARAEAPLLQRLEWAHRAVRLMPWDAEAVRLVGEISLESGRPDLCREGLELLQARRWQRPQSAARAQLMGRLSTVADDPIEGVVSLWRAYQSQPYKGERKADFVTATQEMEGPRRGAH